MWGIIPAAGLGSRFQPLAFSKELLPVGTRLDDGVERPRAVSEHLIERMLLAGVTKLCFVIAPGKSDIVNYFGARIGDAHIAYVVQDRALGLCDAIFRAAPFVGAHEAVLVGLPDTVWFPADGFRRLPDDRLAFLLFPVEQPRFFDAVVTDAHGRVEVIEVKAPAPRTHWVWGGFRMPGRVLHGLHALWRRPERGDEYVGTLVNAWLAEGNEAVGVRAGETYVDVGTLHGWREALAMLGGAPAEVAGDPPWRARLEGVGRPAR